MDADFMPMLQLIAVVILGLITAVVMAFQRVVA